MNAIIGIFIVILGIIFLGNNLNWFDYSLGNFFSDWWPAALIIVGSWMILGQTRRKRSDVWQIKVDKAMSKAVGDQQLKPQEITPEGLAIKLGAGKVELDLTTTRLREGENNVYCSLGVGEVKISLPSGVETRITASCSTGDIQALGKKQSGIAVDLTHEDDNYATAATKLNLKVRLGLGDIKVTRA